MVNLSLTTLCASKFFLVTINKVNANIPYIANPSRWKTLTVCRIETVICWKTFMVRCLYNQRLFTSYSTGKVTDQSAKLFHCEQFALYANIDQDMAKNILLAIINSCFGHYRISGNFWRRESLVNLGQLLKIKQ